MLKVWAFEVKERAGRVCEFCGKPHKWLNSHHIIGKRYLPLRYDLMNGLCLCPSCHKFAPGFAAHENPLRVSEWLRYERPIQFQYLMDHMEAK